MDLIKEVWTFRSYTLPLAKLVSPTITSPVVNPSTKVPVFALMVSVPVPLIISPTVYAAEGSAAKVIILFLETFSVTRKF